MHRWIERVVILVCFLVVTSCAFSQVKKPQISEIESSIIKERTYKSLNNDLLEISKESMKAIGYEIVSFNRKLNSTMTKTQPVPTKGNCDCGSWNSKPVHGTVDFSMKAQLIPVDNTLSKIKIILRFDCSFTGRNIYGAPTRIEHYQCASTGKIEKDFWEVFDQLVLKE